MLHRMRNEYQYLFTGIFRAGKVLKTSPANPELTVNNKYLTILSRLCRDKLVQPSLAGVCICSGWPT